MQACQEVIFFGFYEILELHNTGFEHFEGIFNDVGSLKLPISARMNPEVWVMIRFGYGLWDFRELWDFPGNGVGGCSKPMGYRRLWVVTSMV